MRATLLGVSLAVVAAMAASTPAEAQLGGLMRRAREAAKEKTAEKDPRAPEPTTSTRNPFADPAIVIITQDQLGRFEKALQYEIDQRNELRKALASAKSQEEYQACSQGVAMSPEVMKLVQDWAESSANGTPEQVIKGQQKMAGDMQAIVTKSCGPDPRQTESSRFERLRQIEADASDIAMPSGYTPPPGAQGRAGERPGNYAASHSGRPAGPYANVAFSYRAPRPLFPAFEAGARAQVPNPHPFARAYGMLKERIPVFCAKDKKASAPTTITVGNEKMTVVKVQGQGQEYVYRQDEVDTLNAGCARVMALMNSLFDINIK